jgi:N-acyl-D-aspartate/D-glutamate deacylase
MTADLAIRDVRIIDGTGAPAVEGSVSVEGGRIAEVSVGSTGVGSARAEVDGHGLVLAPGFVDTHTHDDAAFLQHPGLEFKLAQGCTSLVIGNCGLSAAPASTGSALGFLFSGLRADWEDLDGYRRAAEAVGPACNAMALVGHNTLRWSALGRARRAPDAAELDQMRGEVSRAMVQGACGLSTGLVYIPGRYSETDEVVALAAAVSPFGGIYATHIRNEGDGLLEAVDEAISIGREAQVPVHISHHKAAGRRNWGKVAASLTRADEADRAGTAVTLDVYPYTAGSGPMIEYFDLDHIDPELAAVVRLASCPAFPGYEGRGLAEIAAEERVDLEELVRRILTAPEGAKTICIHFIIDEADIETNLRHPRMMIGSDGIPDLAGRPHPRLWGTMPRVLGEYVRERGVLPLEEAVRRMTSLSCERFGLAGRGRIQEGWSADLVLFDPATVIDRATYDDPAQEPVGIEVVVVNGQIAYDHGRHTGVGAGRVLRYGVASA